MTAPDRLDLFAPITKRERDPESGHLYVYGKITGPDLDGDQQRMDPAWLKSAVPDWFRIGNIREMHQSKAVGKALELEEKADGWYIGAKIVDRETAVKIEEEVLTGFSIGIKGPRLDYSKADAPMGLITGGRVVETSVVDRPCLPTAVMQFAKADSADELQPIEHPVLVEKSEVQTFGLLPELYERLAAPVKAALAALSVGGAQVVAELGKADGADVEVPVLVNVTVKTDDADLSKAYSSAERKRMADTGQAMTDGAFPIKTKADLRKAIKAVGRGGADHDDIRAHIITRAKALGLEAMVPDNWNADGSLKDDTEKADAATVAKAEQVLREARALVPDLAKADDAGNEAGDISGANAAIAAIAALIISEAESLAQGNLNEACDIALLLQAVDALKWFSVREANEDNADDDAVMSLAEDADLTKAGKKGNLAPPFKKKGADDADSEDDTEDADGDAADGEDDEKPAPKAAKKKAAAKADSGELLSKADATAAVAAAVAEALAGAAPKTPEADEPQGVTKADLAEMVKQAVAEATAAAEERTTALAADMAKATVAEAIKDLPTVGGPVLTRTSAQQAAAVKSDSDLLRDQANDLLAKAESVSCNRDLAQGYKDRAHALLAKASA